MINLQISPKRPKARQIPHPIGPSPQVQQPIGRPPKVTIRSWRKKIVTTITGKKQESKIPERTLNSSFSFLALTKLNKVIITNTLKLYVPCLEAVPIL